MLKNRENVLNRKEFHDNNFKNNSICYKNNCRENEECKKSKHSSQFIAYITVKFFRYFLNNEFVKYKFIIKILKNNLQNNSDNFDFDFYSLTSLLNIYILSIKTRNKITKNLTYKFSTRIIC